MRHVCCEKVFIDGWLGRRNGLISCGPVDAGICSCASWTACADGGGAGSACLCGLHFLLIESRCACMRLCRAVARSLATMCI